MPGTVTNSQVIEVPDAQIREIAVRVARQAELAMEKVAARHANPSKFALPTQPKSLEQVLQSRFGALPDVTKKAASIQASARLAQPAAVRQRRFKDLARVDLTKATPVEAQAQALPFPAELKISKARFTELTRVPAESAAADVAAAAVAPLNRLELRIHKVRCDDETNGFLGSEAGNDEIDLGGTTVDETGGTGKVSPFRVGSSFDDGEEKVFSPPRRFTFFNLTEGTAFPKSYFVTLVLAEADMGGLPDFINKLLTWVKEKVIAALTAAIGSAIGMSGGPVGAIIGAAVGFAVGLVFDLFKSMWEDDIFKPQTVRVNIPSLTARWPNAKTDGPEGTLTFSGHGGTYRVVYDWRMFAA
jgi:hypothetical protein